MKPSILFLFILCISNYLFAAMPRSAVEVNLRSQIELDLEKKYTSLISTTLLPKDFNLSVSIQINFFKNKNYSPIQGFKNTDLILPSVGLIDSSLMIDNLQEELRLSKQQLQPNMIEFAERQFSIEKIDFLVGLNPEFGQAYVSEFEDWMKNKIKSDFGAKAMVTVQLIKSSPAEKIPEQIKPFLEQIKDFQALIGIFLLSLALMLAVLIYRVLTPKVSDQPIEYNLNLKQNIPNSLELEKPNLPRTEVIKVQPLENFSGKIFKELQYKICSLVSQLGAECQIAVERWINQEHELGLFKTALFFDCSLIEALKNESDFLKLQMSETDTERIFQKMKLISSISNNEKFQTLESVYWDLLALKSLGQTAFVSPFSYLDTNISEKINVIDQQPTQIRSLIALNLPQDAQIQWAKSTENRIIEDVVFEALKMNTFSRSEVLTLSQSMKSQLQNQTKDNHNVYSVLPQFFQNLSLEQEFKVLKRLQSEKNPQLQNLQKNIQSLFFFQHWKTGAQTDFVAGLDTQEIIAWIRLEESHKDTILNSTSSFVKTMVEDDLLRANEIMDLKLQHINLRKKMSEFILKNGGSVSAILNLEVENIGGLRVA